MNFAGSAQWCASTRCTAHTRCCCCCRPCRMVRTAPWCEYSSTCPGMSNRAYASACGARRSSSQSKFAARYSMQYTSAPFGPSSHARAAPSSEMRSRTSTATGYGSVSLAGSRLMTTTFRPSDSRNCRIPSQYVVLPAPGGPTTTCPNISREAVHVAPRRRAVGPTPRFRRRIVTSSTQSSQSVRVALRYGSRRVATQYYPPRVLPNARRELRLRLPAGRAGGRARGPQAERRRLRLGRPSLGRLRRIVRRAGVGEPIGELARAHARLVSLEL